jgi:hypothetical protein
LPGSGKLVRGNEGRFHWLSTGSTRCS